MPPYSPQLNPIARLWKWLKDEVIANVLHRDQKDIAQSITRFEQHVLQHPDEVCVTPHRVCCVNQRLKCQFGCI
nr:transposase [Anoxybacillus flavithermus]